MSTRVTRVTAAYVGFFGWLLAVSSFRQYLGQHLDHWIMLAVQRSKARLMQAQQLHQQGQFEAAIAAYQDVVSDPMLADFHRTAQLKQASLYVQLGQKSAAIESYRTIREQGYLPETSIAYLLDQLVTPEPAQRKTYATYVASSAKTSSAKTSSVALAAPTYHVVLVTDCPGMYGAEQVNHSILLALAARGYRVTCLQSPADHILIRQREQQGIQHVWTEPDNLYDFHGESALPQHQHPRALVDSSEMIAILAELKPDCLLFAGGCIVSNLVSQQVAATLNIPYLALVHRVDAEIAQQFAPYLQALPQLYKDAGVVVTVSSENRARLRAEFGLPPQKGDVIFCGRPPSYFSLACREVRSRIRASLNIPTDAIVVCTTGRLDIDKGYQYQIDALRQLKETSSWSKLHFIWVGAGSLEWLIRVMLKRWGLSDRVHLLGARADVPDLLDASDICVLPSRVEGMPLSVMEAMAKGLAVAATAISGIPEELGETGCLLPDPKQDPAQTITALVDILQQWSANEEQRRAVGQACRARALKYFQEERMTQQYCDRIEALLKTSNSRSE